MPVQIKAKDLKRGMLVDMEYCAYVTDEGDMISAENIFAEVDTVTQEAGDISVVSFGNFPTYALPSDYVLILSDEDEGDLHIEETTMVMSEGQE